MRAEKRLQDFAVSSVLGRVEPQRDHRDWASRWLKRQSSRKNIGTSQRCQHVLTAGEVVVAVHEHHRSGIAQNLPPDATISSHRQGEVVKPRKVKAGVVQAFINGAHVRDLSCRFARFRRRRGGLATVDMVCGPPRFGRVVAALAGAELSDDVRSIF